MIFPIQQILFQIHGFSEDLEEVNCAVMTVGPVMAS